jgi:hypothetical protein
MSPFLRGGNPPYPYAQVWQQREFEKTATTTKSYPAVQKRNFLVTLMIGKKVTQNTNFNSATPKLLLPAQWAIFFYYFLTLFPKSSIVNSKIISGG